MIPASVAVVWAAAYLLSPFSVSGAETIRTAWQAQLTVTSLRFIVLIFY